MPIYDITGYVKLICNGKNYNQIYIDLLRNILI